VVTHPLTLTLTHTHTPTHTHTRTCQRGRRWWPAPSTTRSTCEREKTGYEPFERETGYEPFKRETVCVCVCVRERERERERVVLGDVLVLVNRGEVNAADIADVVARRHLRHVRVREGGGDERRGGAGAGRQAAGVRVVVVAAFFRLGKRGGGGEVRLGVTLHVGRRERTLHLDAQVVLVHADAEEALLPPVAPPRVPPNPELPRGVGAPADDGDFVVQQEHERVKRCLQNERFI